LKRLLPTILLLGLPGLHARAAPASAPAAAPAVERELLPASRPPRTLASQGSWRLRPRSIVAPRGTGFWIAAGEGATLVDGQVRAHAVGGDLTLGLLLRASVDDRGKLEHAIVLHLAGREAWLTLEGRAASRRLGHPVTLRRRAGKAVEITALLLGPHLWVNVFELGSGAELAMLTSDQAPAGDRVGLVGTRGRRGATALTRLATRSACHLQTPPESGGPMVVALLPEAESKLASVSPAVRRLERQPGDPPRVAFRVNPAGLEALFCAGRRLLALQTSYPWKYLDVAYVEQKTLPPQRTPTGFRVDQSSKSPEMVEALLRAWQARYPRLARLVTLGKSHQGRALLALAVGRVGSTEQRPAVLLDGAHHGDEPFSVELTLDAIQRLLEHSGEPRVRRWLEELVIWCVPVVNPDGLAAFLEVARTTGRKNGRGLSGPAAQATDAGVDLNRNYPFAWGAIRGRRLEPRHFRGPAPASEPETQAMMELARRERFVAAVSFHTGTVAVLAPYTIDGVRNPVPNEAWTVAEELAQKLRPHPQGRTFRVRRKLYPVEGTDQDWHRHQHGTLAYILESARHSPIGAAERNRVLDAVRPFWELLLDRFLDGPSLSGRVVDGDGRPLAVEVRLREIGLNEGERWTTRPRDGRFDRLLTRPGRYHLEVLGCGTRLATRTVRVGKEHAELELRISPGPRCAAGPVD